MAKPAPAEFQGEFNFDRGRVFIAHGDRNMKMYSLTETEIKSIGESTRSARLWDGIGGFCVSIVAAAILQMLFVGDHCREAMVVLGLSLAASFASFFLGHHYAKGVNDIMAIVKRETKGEPPETPRTRWTWCCWFRS